MIDASQIKAPPHATGVHDGNQDMGRTQGGEQREEIPGRGCAWRAGQHVCYNEYRCSCL